MLGYDSEDSLSSMDITEDEYVPGSDCESETNSEGGSILKKNAATMASPAVKDGIRKTYKEPRNRNSESRESSITSLPVMHSQKTDDGSRRYTKKHYCLFCEKPLSKIARHLELVHKDQSEVTKAISSPKNSKERKLQLTILRKQGNRAHNIDVIRKGKVSLFHVNKRVLQMSIQINSYIVQIAKGFSKKDSFGKGAHFEVFFQNLVELEPNRFVPLRNLCRKELARDRGRSTGVA